MKKILIVAFASCFGQSVFCAKEDEFLQLQSHRKEQKKPKEKKKPKQDEPQIEFGFLSFKDAPPVPATPTEFDFSIDQIERREIGIAVDATGLFAGSQGQNDIVGKLLGVIRGYRGRNAEICSEINVDHIRHAVRLMADKHILQEKKPGKMSVNNSRQTDSGSFLVLKGVNSSQCLNLAYALYHESLDGQVDIHKRPDSQSGTGEVYQIRLTFRTLYKGIQIRRADPGSPSFDFQPAQVQGLEIEILKQGGILRTLTSYPIL